MVARTDGDQTRDCILPCMMMMIVLVQLIYVICEMYIDDVILHGKTPPEFLKRLKTVLTRFREFKRNLNPIKKKLNWHVHSSIRQKHALH